MITVSLGEEAIVFHAQWHRTNYQADSSRVDFRNPAAFYHDVNSVAGLLKLFFRDLPDPLLTRERYNELIEAARIDDDIVRRDTLHAIVNSLPDAHYATLRALILVSFKSSDPCIESHS